MPDVTRLMVYMGHPRRPVGGLIQIASTADEAGGAMPTVRKMEGLMSWTDRDIMQWMFLQFGRDPREQAIEVNNLLKYAAVDEMSAEDREVCVRAMAICVREVVA